MSEMDAGKTPPPADFKRLGATEPIMKFFAYSHLPPDKQAVSEPFGELAIRVLNLPRSAERSVALRKLLEAKDAAVRASMESP